MIKVTLITLIFLKRNHTVLNSAFGKSFII